MLINVFAVFTRKLLQTLQNSSFHKTWFLEAKEIICYGNIIFMAFFSRNSVNFYCSTWNARALNCYATVLLCNSIGHGRGLDRVFGFRNVLSPTRDDFWPGYKAGTHFSSLDHTSFLHRLTVSFLYGRGCS